MAKVRVGLIGCGFIGRFHSWGIRGAIKLGLVDAEYVGVCDMQEERAREFAGIFGVPNATADPQEIIASPEINAVYVCTPTVHHKELVLATVAAGKHVFCEKPLAADLADVREMCAAVQRAGVVHQVGLVLRHSPIFTVLKSLTEDPSLGRPMAAIFRDDQFFPVGGHYASTWRADHRLAGRGTLLEHSIHDMDLLRWLCGEPVLLRAETRFFSGREMVEDLGTVHLEFESGALGALFSIWHNILRRPSTRRLELFFENGYFAVDHDFFGPIHCQLDDRPAEVIPEKDVRERYLALIGRTEAIYKEAPELYSLADLFFLEAAQAGKPAHPDFGLALRAHELLDAIYRSAESRSEVRPEPPRG
jgi:UDP-N-acetyl-2-amino-2-deoxyglucuronate dehydrogenase